MYIWQNENNKKTILSAATMDSAVTVGHYGAKNFLLRDRKEVIECVFYENVSSEGTVKSMICSYISIE